MWQAGCIVESCRGELEEMVNGQRDSEEREGKGGMCRSTDGRAMPEWGVRQWQGMALEEKWWVDQSLPVSIVDEKEHSGSGVRVVMGGCADEEGGSGQGMRSRCICRGSGYQEQEGVVQAHNEEEGTGGDNR